MARANQETVTTFGEVLHSANISYSQNRMNTPDNRLMIYGELPEKVPPK